MREKTITQIPIFILPSLIRRYLRQIAKGRKRKSNIAGITTLIENVFDTTYYKETYNPDKSRDSSYERRLTKLIRQAGADYDILIRLSDLMAFNEVLGGEFTRTPLLSYDINLFDIFEVQERLDIYIPEIWNDKTVATHIFHKRIIEAIEDSKELPPTIIYQHVKQEEPELTNYINTDWYKSLNDNKEHAHIICGHSLENPAVEVTLAEKYFNIIPFKPIDKKNLEKKDWLPIYTYFPDVKDAEKSAFHMPFVMINDNFPQESRAAKNRRSIIVNGKLYISDNKDEYPKKKELINYGVLALTLCGTPSGSQAISIIYGVILSPYSPVSLAIADRLLSGNKPVPFLLPRFNIDKKPHILTIVIKATIGINEQIKAKYGDNIPPDIEWRSVKEIDIVDVNLACYEEKQNEWKIKEHLDSNPKRYIYTLGEYKITKPDYPLN